MLTSGFVPSGWYEDEPVIIRLPRPPVISTYIKSHSSLGDAATLHFFGWETCEVVVKFNPGHPVSADN